MTVGARDSLATRLKWKAGEESRTCWVITSPSWSSSIRARTSWTVGRSFWNSSNRAFWRAASKGPVRVPTLASLASSGSLRTLEGVTPSLEPLAMAWWPRLRSLRGSLTLRLRQGGSLSGGGSSAPSESVLEALLICSWTSGVDWEVLGTGSSDFNTCCLGPPPPGGGGADDTLRLQAAGVPWTPPGALPP